MAENMNLTILPGAATEDAKEIANIVKTIDEDMKELDDKIKKLIPDRVETHWSTELKERWEKFYAYSVKESMEDMMQSSVNLQNAVDKALEYNE